MASLTGSQRKWLRGRAHALRPVVQVGKQGLTESALGQIDAALEAHELVKIQAPGSKDEKRATAARIEETLGAEVVGLIGHVLILFRPHPDPDERRIEPPPA